MTRTTLPNGARLIVSEQHALPMVVIHVLIDAGGRRDPAGKEGLASLTADLLTEGTKTRSAMQISEAVDFIGASLDSSADIDSASIGLTVLSKDLDTGLSLLTDVLLHPTYPEAEVSRRRDAALANIKASDDEPGRVAQRAFVQSLFKDEPYGHEVVGNAQSVRTLTRKDLLAFYAKFYRPARSIIAVSGDVSATDIEARLGAALQSWQGSAPEFVYPAGIAGGPLSLSINKPISQANVILGERGVARNNPDFYAITVMNFILGGGGFTSRLLDTIRTKGGLAYSVASGFSANQSPGSFQVVLQTKNASANEAIQKACGEIERIRREPVSDEELSGAQLYLTGSFPMKFDSNAKVVGFLAQVEFFRLGDDYADTYAQRINAVTAADILRVAQTYLHPEKLRLVVVGNLEQANVPDAAPCRAAPGS